MKTGRKRKITAGNMLAKLAGKSLLAAAAFALVGAGTVDAELFGGWSEIGDPENTADTTTFGKVDYTYRIGKFAVSDNDYSSLMGTASGSDLPKVSISLYGAMAFANALTEAEHGSNAYNLYTLTTDGEGVYDGVTINKTRTQVIADGKIVYAIPTEDEWYKAAYYDASVGNGSADNYSLYAHGSDTRPAEGTAETADDGWNFLPGDGTDIGIQDVGFSTAEQNDTHDMMGNVWEWQENLGGVIRGGRHNLSATYLQSVTRDTTTAGPTDEFPTIGFRVVAIPEPASGALFVLVGGLLLLRRRLFGSRK